jgi:small ligand-binding sensory domain FIST
MPTPNHPFVHAHATHPDWRIALALAAAQIDGQRAQQGLSGVPTLGWVYLTEAYVSEADALLADLHLRWPGTQWVGASATGIAASGVEYVDEPALVLMVGDVAPGSFRVFSGAQPLQDFPLGTALVHADGLAPELADLLHELAALTQGKALFGGVTSGRRQAVQIAEGVFNGGLSGLALHPSLRVISRTTQGCHAIGPVRRVTRYERNQVLSLDGQPALSCLMADLGLSSEALGSAVPRLGNTLAGLGTVAGAMGLAAGQSFGAQVQVRRLVGVSPGRGAVALAEDLDACGAGHQGRDEPLQLAFGCRDPHSAWRDLVRVCSEIRDELVPEDSWTELPALARCEDDDPAQALIRARVAGAIYVSCVARGGAYFGGPSAELHVVRQALGDVPLVGFFAAGEIADDQLHSYAGVLTVFVRTA